jgi:hypothetical protein
VPCDDILATGRGAFVEVHGWMPLSNPFARSQLRANRPASSHVLSRKTVEVGVAHAESRISASFEGRWLRAELSGAHGSRHGVEEAILTPNARIASDDCTSGKPAQFKRAGMAGEQRCVTLSTMHIPCIVLRRAITPMLV